MTNFWALIATSRPHCFSLGKHEDEEAALAFANAYCDRRNGEIDAEEPQYAVLALLDLSDIRSLTGEVHYPWKISPAEPKREVAVEAPTRQGTDHPVGTAGEETASVNEPEGDGHTCQDGGGPCGACNEEYRRRHPENRG